MAKKLTRSRRQRRPPDAEAGADAMPISGDASAGKVTAVSLPPHLVDCIPWYLSAVDSARLAAVCKSWSVIAARRLADPAPHLFAFRSTSTHRRGDIITAVPAAGEFASSRHVAPAHPELRRVTRRTGCLGATAGGRLVLANTRRTVLFNPVTGTFRRIKKFPGKPLPHRVSPMPVVPLAGDSFFHAGRNKVGVWHAEDDTWTARHIDYAESLRMAVLCGVGVFALDTEGYVFMIDLTTFYATKVPVPSLLDKDHTALTGAVEKGYLVEAAGEVFFVWPLFTTSRVRAKHRDFDPELFVFSDDEDDDGEDDDYFFDDVTRLSGFDVYRLDISGMRWVGVDRLGGDVALFVSRWSSFSVRASEKGCVSNCVYFVCDEGAGNTWGAFSLGERSMLFEHDIGAGGSYKERLWFYPSLKEPGQEDVGRRLDEIGYI
ncbi:unnamed protein product [Urochloa decumbens]|uniref:KIB1-4 beta-propeller domain-containing protein n=1 Tax=Urochloa decumbens TaxID=240449 RepID=A0ABC9BPP2_9POAL